jgi:hypothetical protein
VGGGGGGGVGPPPPPRVPTDCLTLACTEVHSPEDIAALVGAVKEAL